MREKISIFMIFYFFFILHVYFQFYFLFACLVYFVYLVWILITHYNLYTILNLIGKSSKHLYKNPEVIYHFITVMRFILYISRDIYKSQEILKLKELHPTVISRGTFIYLSRQINYIHIWNVYHLVGVDYFYVFVLNFVYFFIIILVLIW